SCASPLLSAAACAVFGYFVHEAEVVLLLVTVTLKDMPLARLDLLQFRICSLSRPVSTVQPVTPVWLVTEYEVTPVPSGNVSTSVTLVAVPGPLFLTTTV